MGLYLPRVVEIPVSTRWKGPWVMDIQQNLKNTKPTACYIAQKENHTGVRWMQGKTLQALASNLCHIRAEEAQTMNCNQVGKETVQNQVNNAADGNRWRAGDMQRPQPRREQDSKSLAST